MKALYSCLSQSWGGMEMFTITAVSQLIKNGYEVDLLCYPGSPIHQKALQENISTFPVKFNRGFSPIAVSRVLNLLNNNKYDFIHTQASGDLWVISPAIALCKKKLPLFLTKQVGSYIVKKDFLHKFVYGKVTLALAISKVIRKNLIDTTPLSSEKIVVLHNGVSTDRFNPGNYSGEKLRREFGIGTNEIVIGMTARFTPGKGYEELIKAAKILKKKFSNLKYLLVGEASRGEDEYFNKIKKMTRDSGIDDRVIFAGYRENMPEAFAAMDIFAFPSHSEAFGIALVEAMSMGLPSVCSRKDGILDICVENETGLFFQPKNEIDLADKLEILIENKDLRKRLSKKARERAVKFFDIELLTKQVIELYEKYVST